MQRFAMARQFMAFIKQTILAVNVAAHILKEWASKLRMYITSKHN